MANNNSTGTVNSSTTAITPVEVPFHEDTIPAFIANDGEVYVAVNQVLRNIGFNEDRVKAIKIKWRDDEVVSSRGRKFDLLYSSGFGPHSESTYCLPSSILHIALAKIAVTPTLKREYPEVARKLYDYEMECADVLHDHFFRKSTTVAAPTTYSQEELYRDSVIPITREEALVIFANYTNVLGTFIQKLDNAINRQTSTIERQNVIIENQNVAIEKRDKDIQVLTNKCDQLIDCVNEFIKTDKETINASTKYLKNQDEYRKIEINQQKIQNDCYIKLIANLERLSTPHVESQVSNTEEKHPTTSEILTSTISAFEKKEWMENVWDVAARIAVLSGRARSIKEVTKEDKVDVLRECYDILREQGYKLHELVSEWVNIRQPEFPSIIGMIADSDILRPEMKRAMIEVYNKYRKNKIKNLAHNEFQKVQAEKRRCKFLSSELIRIPVITRALIQKYADSRKPHKIPFSVAAGHIYKEIERETGKDLRAEAKTYAESLGYKKCCVGRYVSSNEDLFTMLYDIVTAA